MPLSPALLLGSQDTPKNHAESLLETPGGSPARCVSHGAASEREAPGAAAQVQATQAAQ